MGAVDCFKHWDQFGLRPKVCMISQMAYLDIAAWNFSL